MIDDIDVDVVFDGDVVLKMKCQMLQNIDDDDERHHLHLPKQKQKEELEE